MSLPQGKREFIRKLVAGLDNLMEITQIANQIGISPRNEIEEFIKKHFLVQTDTGEYSVNKVAFRMGVQTLDFDILSKVLMHLDKLKIKLKNVFDRANLNPLYFDQEGMLYARLIEMGDLKTFLDLILY
jgi:hypothetical protein